MTGKHWRVKAGTQVDISGKIRVGGDEFTATDAEVDEFGSRPYVDEVRQQAAPKAADKKVSAPEPHPGKDTAKRRA